MKQIIQSFKTGETILEEVPVPVVGDGEVLIRTVNSLVSLGTERMLVEFGKANLIQKARQQPEKVKMVLDKIKSEGLLPTLDAVFKKLEQPLPLGYCNAGVVINVGAHVTQFKIGDKVASNGHHAEFVSVPQNLCAKIPESVTYAEASFTVIGAIGLQGIRLLKPTLGETVVVIGLGLIGLITGQLLKASGCNVIGLDIDQRKLDIAENYGISVLNPSTANTIKYVESLTEGIGADGVIITASSKSNDIIKQAAHMSRKRGRIVLVGVIGLQLDRADFYEKELTFQVSSSYGPGRYDETYEQKGIDYPLPYVRWTEQRNFKAILKAIELGNLKLSELITEKLALEDFKNVYNNLKSNTSIASIFMYDSNAEITYVVKTSGEASQYSLSGDVAVVGAGNFTKMTMLPAMKDYRIKYIVSKGGLSAKSLAKKHSIEFSATDYDRVLKDPTVSLIMITTRHNLHASMIIKALKSGKGVFVEKPLSITSKELQDIISVKKDNNLPITVGFNRRFSPHMIKIKSLVTDNSHKNMVATMNAGFIPKDVWVHDLDIGGGRIIGEACHYIDLLTFISGSLVQSVCMNALGVNPQLNSDNASILLKFKNGDIGTINYFSNGSKKYSKERLEVYWDEKTIIMDNFKETIAYGVEGFNKMKTKIDKGHQNQFNLLQNNLKNGEKELIPFEQIVNTTEASFACLESLKNNSWIQVER